MRANRVGVHATDVGVASVCISTGRVTVTPTGLNLEFYDVDGNLIDSREVPPDC